MSPGVSSLLRDAKAVVVALWIEDGGLRYRGSPDATERLLPSLRAHKPELLDALASSTSVAHWRWRIRLGSGAIFDAYYTPAANREDVQRHYPDAEVEPMPDEAPGRQATNEEDAELRRLVAVVYANDSDVDRAEVLAMAFADVERALLCYRGLMQRQDHAVQRTDTPR
jgi:hypothetical protein